MISHFEPWYFVLFCRITSKRSHFDLDIWNKKRIKDHNMSDKSEHRYLLEEKKWTPKMAKIIKSCHNFLITIKISYYGLKKYHTQPIREIRKNSLNFHFSINSALVNFHEYWNMSENLIKDHYITLWIFVKCELQTLQNLTKKYVFTVFALEWRFL